MLTKTEIATSKVTEYTWDYRNRLTSVKLKDAEGTVIGQSDYTYDALDKRIGVSVDPDGEGLEEAVERWTVYDGANPYADFDGSGDLTHRYLYGPAVDMIVGRLSAAGDIAWYLSDHLGTVRDLADTSGNVIDHIQYDSFGGILSESNPSAGDRFKFTGREYDSATGLYYYRARYYDAAIGRFLSEDPLGFGAGDMNVQRYVGNSPLHRCDPMGTLPSTPGGPGMPPDPEFFPPSEPMPPPAPIPMPLGPLVPAGPLPLPLPGVPGIPLQPMMPAAPPPMPQPPPAGWGVPPGGFMPPPPTTTWDVIPNPFYPFSLPLPFLPFIPVPSPAGSG